MDAAACIGCGACVAACKNASAMLFVAAKVGHLAQPAAGPGRSGASGCWRWSRSTTARGSGTARTQYECEAACPKEISVEFIAQLNRDYIRGALKVVNRREAGALGRGRLNPLVSSTA